jgi:hypothetical protein
MVVVSVTGHTPIGNSHLHWAFQTEGYYRIPRDSHGAATNLSTGDGPYNRSHNAIIALRFDAIRVGSDAVSLPIHNDRFQVEYQIIVGSYSNDQFGIGASRDRESSILAPDILIHRSIVNAIVSPLDVYRLIHADRNHRAGLESRKPSPIPIPVPVPIPVAVLG